MINYIVPDPKDPAYPFMRGNPAQIIGATKFPRILIIGLHGTEHLAARVAYYIQSTRPELLSNVDYICGNPKGAAAIPQERYTNEYGEESERGSDLNRSFYPEKTPKTYEEKRAQELLPQLHTYDYVLDLHTTTTSGGDLKRYAITVSPDNESVRTILAASSIERVVVFPQDDGYMTNVVKPTLALEYNQELARTPAAIEEVVDIIDVLLGNKTSAPRSREFFYIERPIPRAEDPGIDTPNFELCKDGYYPVLLGDNSYRKDPSKPYVGFAATRKEIVTL